jgi:hypothetical protein
MRVLANDFLAKRAKGSLFAPTARESSPCRCSHQKQVSLYASLLCQSTTECPKKDDGSRTYPAGDLLSSARPAGRLQDLSANYFDERQRQAIEKRLVRRLEKLGYEVSLQPAAQVA